MNNFPMLKKEDNKFLKELKVELSLIKTSDKIYDNQNNFGPQNYKGELKKLGVFKFSKLAEINQLDFNCSEMGLQLFRNRC